MIYCGLKSGFRCLEVFKFQILLYALVATLRVVSQIEFRQDITALDQTGAFV